MKVTVYTLRRRGRRTARQEAEGAVGELSLFTNGAVGELHLYRRDPLASKDSDVIPPLYEPRLAALGNQAIMLRGYESIDGAAFVQEWHCLLP